MTSKPSRVRAGVFAAAWLATCAAGPASAQIRVNGAIARPGLFGRTITPDEFQIVHAGEFKGAHRVAISVFNVAFPNENHFVAKSRGAGSFVIKTSTASMKTSLEGVDAATRQRIADNAYAAFVDQLKAAGYDVVERDELARLAPEYGQWPAQPNFSEGRFGAYVAPTGRSVYFLQGDTAKRDTSGLFGQQMSAFRALDRPQAFTRSPYVAHDAKLGVIAVTLVVDYGAYSSSGRTKGFRDASASFEPGVTIAAGNAIDQGSLIEYWGPSSGGFPAVAFLQKPVRSERPFGELEGAPHSGDYTLKADPAKFQAAADEAVGMAVGKLVGVMSAAR